MSFTQKSAICLPCHGGRCESVWFPWICHIRLAALSTSAPNFAMCTLCGATLPLIAYRLFPHEA